MLELRRVDAAEDHAGMEPAEARRERLRIHDERIPRQERRDRETGEEADVGPVPPPQLGTRGRPEEDDPRGGLGQGGGGGRGKRGDRKSTRLNSSHLVISYAVSR